MSNKQELTRLFKIHGHDKVIFIGFDISKLFHVFSIANGYGEILLQPTKIDIYLTSVSWSNAS